MILQVFRSRGNQEKWQNNQHISVRRRRGRKGFKLVDAIKREGYKRTKKPGTERIGDVGRIGMSESSMSGINQDPPILRTQYDDGIDDDFRELN